MIYGNIKTTMKKIAFILTMLLIPALIFAKELGATLIMKDGSTRTGLVKPPKKPTEKTLKFKILSSEKWEQVVCADITTMIIQNTDGTSTEFDYLPGQNYIQVWKGRPKISKISIWLPVVVRGGAMTYYRIWYEDNGPMRFDGYMSRSVRAYLSYCKRVGETYASKIGRTDVKTAFSHMAGPVYFKDDPSIVAKIESGEFTLDDLPQVVELYNSTHK